MSSEQGPRNICQHLILKAGAYLVWFTGQGKELNWVCEACAEGYPDAPDSWATADPCWLAQHQDRLYWRGVVGRPEVAQRSTTLRFEHFDWALEPRYRSHVVDIQPCPTGQNWYALLTSSVLLVLNSGSAVAEKELAVSNLGFEINAETGLCLSDCGHYAVVFQQSGSSACLFRLADGHVIKRISRGDYRPENSCFPVTFWKHGNQTLLVAGTDWNRLDLIDCATGHILSERGPHSYQNDVRPPHYLDYFHGGLSVSPGGQFIVDNGWVWQPAGVMTCWRTDAWLANPWESEHGDSVWTVAVRDFWDSPICWLDETTLAMWGYGDDEWVLPAIVKMDVRNETALDWFPGPQVRQAGAWPPRSLAQSLFFDEYLFAVSEESGTTVWDAGTGERLHADSQARPWRYHRAAREFVEVKADALRLSKLIKD